MANIHDKYKKHELRDHIYVLPAMYIGSADLTIAETYIYDDTSKRMIKKELSYVPGLYKIFDEIIVNAIDQTTRLNMSYAPKDAKQVKNIWVTINKETGEISVTNDGDGIDIDKHPEHKVWIPELIFGELLTSTNYDQSQEKRAGGTHGIGAKATNIFSKDMVVETVDWRNKKIYKQRFFNNMKEREPAIVKAYSKTPFTRITFTPDYARFGIKGMTDDIYELFKKRVYDCCATTPASVTDYFNDVKLEAKTFERYTDLYLGDKVAWPRAYEASADGYWEVVATYSEHGVFDQVSFVNGINTIRGGKHVDYISNQIAKNLVDMMAKKKKTATVQHIKANLMVFIKSSIVNPAFDSQSKETLNTPVTKFGSKFEVSDKFMAALYKTGIADRASSLTAFHDTKKASKTDGKKTSRIIVPKLDDANLAGTKYSEECTLCLTEGDSARTMAIAGLSVVGRDRYGVFPLRGKMLNVKDAALTKISQNEEITNLKKILGLEQGKNYADKSSLRYGKIMILTDQDVDGYHIKGLLFNIFESLWPTLYKMDGFLTAMMTPIIKVFNKSTDESHVFYNESDYEKWKITKEKSGVNAMKGWNMKYYKGLGTSTENEAKEYFSHPKMITYTYSGAPSDEGLNLAFNKKRADDRKDWLMHYERDKVLDYNAKNVPYEEFVHKELIHFSNRDLERSINHICDGLKESTRKILYGCLKRRLFKNEIKVAQLAAYVSEVSAYHHGEASLQQAITGMAQVFVGTNNINILQPNGQFGCLAPDTDIIMFDSTIKKAKDIKIGDKLIGDDGKVRNVLNITSGIDTMYEICMIDKKSYIVNSQHILTLKFKGNKSIYWKDSSKQWKVDYFDTSNNTCKSMTISTNESTHNSHFNSSILSKEQAYDKIKSFVETLKFPDVFDIKLEDLLKLSKSNQTRFYCVKNSSCIEWEKSEIPIDPYILGCWLGDGSSNGTGITSMDEEIVEEFVKYYDKISCELVHDINNKNRAGITHEGYHFTVRKKGYGNRTSIGDITHSPTNCIGCQTSDVKHNICNFKIDKQPIDISKYIGVACNGMKRKDMNPWKELLKTENLFNNKHIPINYIYNDKNTRLQLLAGIIDTDGTVKTNNGIPIIEISQCERVHGHIIKSIELIAQSLGYRTSIEFSKEIITKKGEISKMMSILIYGNGLDEIPTRLPRKKIIYSSERIKDPYVCGFQIKELGPGEFNGWSIDGNERFLLGDFTITHNSRIQGGNDAASPRYIYTLLSELARAIYREEDSPVLSYLDDDGTPVEPTYYIPIICMVLVNGALGIGTGFSTNVPQHNPSDIIAHCEKFIEALDVAFKKSSKQIETTGDLGVAYDVINTVELPLMNPWYLGFNGTIFTHKEGSFASRGAYRWIDDTTVEINELPIGVWTDDYKEFLEGLVSGGHPILKNFVNHCTTKSIKFHLNIHPGSRAAAEAVFETEFKMVSTKNMSLNNIHLYTAEGAIKKYKDTNEVCREWACTRLEKYLERKNHQLHQMEQTYILISAKVRFIQEIIDEKLKIMNKKIKEVEAQLIAGKYPAIKEEIKVKSAGDIEASEAEVEEAATVKADGASGYSYLTRMPIHQLTYEKKQALEKEAAEIKAKIEALRSTPIHHIWRNELRDLSKIWEAYKNEVEADYAADRESKVLVAKKKAPVRAKK